MHISGDDTGTDSQRASAGRRGAVLSLAWLGRIALVALSATAAMPEGARAACPGGSDGPGGVLPGFAERAARQARLAQSLEAGFGVQYWGEAYTPRGLAAAPHGLLLIEATRVGAEGAAREQFFTAEDIRKIARDGARPVLAYINLAELAPYRDDWANLISQGWREGVDPAPPWFGGRSAQAEPLAAFWTPEWEAILLARLERLLALGVDGIFLDDALHYYTWASGNAQSLGASQAGTGRPNTPAAYARAMMSLVERLAAQARSVDCTQLVIVNGAVYIGRDARGEGATADAGAAFDRFRASIDAILVESMLAPAPQTAVIDVLHQDFLDAGIAVMTIDFAPGDSAAASAAFRDEIAQRARAAGFFPYVADTPAFDRLYAPLSAAR